MGTDFAYPESEQHPPPRGGTEAQWCEWVSELTANGQFGVTCVSFTPGHVVLEVRNPPARPNPNGSVHGGVMAAILDDAFGAVFMSAADPDTLPATASLTVDYLRPAFVPLRIDVRVTSTGRSLMHCEATVHGADGKLTNRSRAIMAVKPMSAGQPLHAV